MTGDLEEAITTGRHQFQSTVGHYFRLRVPYPHVQLSVLDLLKKLRVLEITKFPPLGTVVGFWRYPQPGGGTHPPIPRGEYSGKCQAIRLI